MLLYSARMQFEVKRRDYQGTIMNIPGEDEMRLRVWEDKDLRGTGRTTRMLLAIRDCVDRGDDAVVVVETLEHARTLAGKLESMMISSTKLARIRYQWIGGALDHLDINGGTVVFVDHRAAEMMAKMVVREMRAGVQFSYQGVK